MTEVKRFVIDRNVWLRGDWDKSRLLDHTTGRRCCVGIYLSACGISDDYLELCGQAEEVKADGVPEWLVREDKSASLAAKQLYTVNDDPGFDGKTREGLVSRAFARQGITVKFTG